MQNLQNLPLFLDENISKCPKIEGNSNKTEKEWSYKNIIESENN